MKKRIGLVALIVPDYDAAIAFYVQGLGFDLSADETQGGKRWVVVRPTGAETGLLIARAVGPEQEAAVGNQTGGRVGFFWKRTILIGMPGRLCRQVESLKKPRAMKPMGGWPCSKTRSETDGI